MKQTVSDAVVFECDLPEPRDKVWRALTREGAAGGLAAAE